MLLTSVKNKTVSKVAAHNRAVMSRNTSAQTLPFNAPMIQHKPACACGGTCPKCQAKQGIQAKLKVGAANDKYEQEAGRVADQVMRMPAPQIQRQDDSEEEAEAIIQTKSLAESITSLVQRHDTEDEDEGLVQAKLTGDAAHLLSSTINNDIQSMQSGGQPLSKSERKFFEPRIGADFSKVRVHNDARSARAARAINARAFTQGHNVAFGAGEYSPDTSAGKELLAHELTHVVQQSQAGSVLHLQKKDKEPKVAQRLGMKIITYPDGKIEAIVNRPWTEESGVGSTVIAMAKVTGLSEAMLVTELIDSGAYRDEDHVRRYFFEGTRVVVNAGAIEEISVRGKVYKAGGKVKPDFEYFLNEGVDKFRGAEFGLCAGDKAGRDPADGYDARYWKEEKKKRGVIRSRIPAWDAMDKLVKNIGKDVPRAGGGKTKWSFDCFEAALILRLYAIWRSSSRSEFNSKYRPLRFGFHARTPVGLGKPIYSDGPGKPAYHWEGTFEGGMSIDARQVFETETIEKILSGAPVGSMVSFGSEDIQGQCRREEPGAVCAFQIENTIKLGKDRFWAHPFGAVTKEKIFEEMAKAAGKKPSAKYYKDHLYISAILFPK